MIRLQDEILPALIEPICLYCNDSAATQTDPYDVLCRGIGLWQRLMLGLKQNPGYEILKQILPWCNG